MKLSSKMLAGALIAALPMSGAFACNITAWSSSQGAPVPNNPAGGVARYAGLCGLETVAGGNSFVVSDHPIAATDTTYRARFYVYTSPTAAAKVFEAYSDAGAATPVIGVTYTPGGANGSFAVAIPGSVVAPIAGIKANHWYGIEVLRQVGAPAEVRVRGGGGGGIGGNPAQARQSIPFMDLTVAGVGNATGAGVETARLGAIGATTGQVSVDEFDSSRGATAIGFLLRGDANNSGGVDAGDVIAINRESVGAQTNSGQPDCNETGAVDAGDVLCAARVSVGF